MKYHPINFHGKEKNSRRLSGEESNGYRFVVAAVYNLPSACHLNLNFSCGSASLLWRYNWTGGVTVIELELY